MSAYWEAAGNEAQAEELKNASRMNHLRSEISAMVTSGTGIRHIAAVAKESLEVLLPIQRSLVNKLKPEQVDVGNIDAQIDSIELVIAKIDDLADRMRGSLGNSLDRHVRATMHVASDLRSHLRNAIRPEIERVNPLSEEQINRLRLRKTQAVDAWLKGHQGPLQHWSNELSTFEETCIRYLDTALDVRVGIAAAPPLKVGELTSITPSLGRTIGDVARATAAFIGVATPAAAGVAWVIGSIAFTTIAFPAALVTAASALSYASLASYRRRKSAISEQRDKLNRDLDQEADLYIKEFEAAIRSQGQGVLDNAVNYLNDYRTDLQQRRSSLVRRQSEPDLTRSRSIIAMVEPLTDMGRQLQNTFTKISSLA